MNVLSLFDGMSCGQIALNKAGIKYDNYFASEIDKHSIQITQKNYPNTKQLGDITKIKGSDLPQIDLVFGGSPCQSFSNAGARTGFDGKSGLFWEFMRILEEVKPTYFLLENVVMKKEWEQIINKELNCEPISINSNLISAQSRERLYWTNIPNIEKPKEKKIILKDILEKEEDIKELKYYTKGNSDSEYFYFDGNTINYDKKTTFIKVDNHKSKNGLVFIGGLLNESNKLWRKDGTIGSGSFSQGNRVYSEYGKTPTISANSGGIGGKTGLYKINDKIRKLTPIECERLQTVPDNYTEGVSNTHRYTMLGNGWTADVIAHVFSHLPDSWK
jgi:DNA (cytosine-5)-methyltransferase 3A